MIEKTEFVAWIEGKHEMLYRVARTILRNDEDCKDALQSAVLKAWENRRKLRDAKLFGTWLTRILINECHALRRKNSKYLLQDEVADTAVSRAPDPALQQALEGLPERLRLPLTLHYLGGYTYEEIAGMLRLPQSTVRSRLSKARGALRMALEADKEAWLHEAQ